MENKESILLYEDIEWSVFAYDPIQDDGLEEGEYEDEINRLWNSLPDRERII